jgi:hypothetical protein
MDTPVFAIPDESDQLERALGELRSAVLEHPHAARAIASALAREGRRFAATPSGAALSRRLRASDSVARACMTFDAATSWLLAGAEEQSQIAPSDLLDALMSAGEAEHVELVLDRLHRGRA